MDSRDDIRKVIFFFSVLILIGGVALSLRIHSFAAAATWIMWALVCLSSGGAVGFLFGIPKILQTDNAASADTSYRQQPNTNLEQISDWLTKIIVGLGLIEIRSIPPFLYRMAETLARGIGAVEDHLAFALALIPYFLAVGFLFGFIVTRIFLAPAFARADREAGVRDLRDYVVKLLDILKGNVDPAALKKVILETKPETVIKGGGLDEENDKDKNEKAKFGQEFDELTKQGVTNEQSDDI